MLASSGRELLCDSAHAGCETASMFALGRDAIHGHVLGGACSTCVHMQTASHAGACMVGLLTATQHSRAQHRVHGFRDVTLLEEELLHCLSMLHVRKPYLYF